MGPNEGVKTTNVFITLTETFGAPREAVKKFTGMETDAFVCEENKKYAL